MKELKGTYDKLNTVESTINQLHQSVHEVNLDFQSIKEQMKTMEANINTVTQKASQIQTTIMKDYVQVMPICKVKYPLPYNNCWT